jgi:hypothetical protein
MVSNDVIEGVELSPYCGERYRYVRYYNDGIHSLDGYGDNEFRLFRALLYYTDVDSLCVDLRGSLSRFRLIELAYRGIDSVDGNIRRYQGSMRILLRHRLVLDSRSVTGSKSVMVNPYVAFAGDFHDRKRAIRVWKKLFVSKV